MPQRQAVPQPSSSCNLLTIKRESLAEHNGGDQGKPRKSQVLSGLTTVKRIHIIGRKNSGKTTLIVDLVKHLTSLGYRVGTVKHTHHHHELDTPGKDSFRHSQAGAAVVGIISPGMNAVFWPHAEVDIAPDRYDQMLAAFPQCDLLLVEGDSQSKSLKIEVWRGEVSADPLAATDPSIHAIVTDDAARLEIPTWSRRDVAALATRLIELTAE